MIATSTAPLPASACIRRWSTDAAAPAQRLDYWVGAICEGFLEMEATSPSAAVFHSSLESVSWGNVAVNRVCGSAQDVYRTRAAIARSRDNYLYLLCKSDSAWTAVQEQRGARLLPGDLVLVDSRQRYEFHFPTSANTVSLQLHPEWLAAWLPDVQAALGQRIDGSAGWGAVLSAFARELTPELAAAPPLPSRLLMDQLGALMALAMGAPAAAARGHAFPSLRQRILDQVREQHAQPGLTAGAVAASLCISPRTLHRCLAEGGMTFAEHLMACRMSVAARLLSDPRFGRLTVAEIGRRVGLLDASHFVRACRLHLGATPARFRRKPQG
ncbi:AraC-type DNA-binding protein [Variovorax sp. HW608]|uniref:AraC family transcriptional regulator n=1 Tax=Variovorax sp. HW608 TaxID=1034889 RepID=UPI00081F9533|nr:AraC family transcriptional regulator [Variovorax sp. HW608]SCK30539.1 AraC-type DNA-binding protein [Variovorax sp. HW608]